MNPGTSSRRPPSRFRLPLWLLLLLGALFLLLLGWGTVWLFQTTRAMASAWEISSPEFTAVSEQQPDAPSSADAPLLADENNPQDLSPSNLFIKPWSGQQRINVLLLGIDQRCDETGPTHTDSMMLLTIDPVGKSAAMLSLPRDLWVDIPQVGVDRVNQAFYYGELYELPGGGPLLASETVEQLLGIPIEYFVTVNFDAFVEVVDLIGGIEVDVPEAISDPAYPDRCYGYDPFYIEAGEQQLSGEMALKYARTRATFGGDVDRAGRQQAVLLAVRDRVVRIGILQQLISQAPQLWQSLQENVRTNLTVEEGIQLALLLQDVPEENIQTAVIDFQYVYNETTPDGRQVLVPIRDSIRGLRNDLFAPPLVPTPVFENLPAKMAEEGARIAVYNGTAVFGLAASTQSYLESFDLDIVEIGNADSAEYATTQIIDYGSHPDTTLYITQLMQVPPLNISNGSQPDGDYDVLIIVGNDWRVPGN